MKKILLLCILLSCINVYGKEIIIKNSSKQFQTKSERIVQKNIWGLYMKEMEERIKKNWTPPKNTNYKRVSVKFTVSKDGKLLNSEITKTSGLEIADKAALDAIEKSFPYKPLPDNFKEESIPIEFTFDYNVLNHMYN